MSDAHVAGQTAVVPGLEGESGGGSMSLEAAISRYLANLESSASSGVTENARDDSESVQDVHTQSATDFSGSANLQPDAGDVTEKAESEEQNSVDEEAFRVQTLDQIDFDSDEDDDEDIGSDVDELL